MLTIQIQPAYPPREDLTSIDVNYRRIPVMAVGKDVYCDSRLIVHTLEALYPEINLTPATPADDGIRKLFQSWTDTAVFGNAVKMMPYWAPNGILQNTSFLDDREKLMGKRMTAEGMKAGRPDGAQHMRQALDFLETTFLADGRCWILGTENITLADIDAVWPFAWLLEDPFMKGSLPEQIANETRFPHALAYVRRFMVEINKKKLQAPKATTLNGETMRNRVLKVTTDHRPSDVISDDPLQLKPGDEVQVFASDYGSSHKDRGAIVGLTLTEVVIRNAKGLHLHFPRWNFRINRLKSAPPVPALHSNSMKPVNMRLIYHPFSPYTRKVYVLAHELGLASQMMLQKVVVCPIPFPGWSDNNDDVAVYNPIAKIPCLVTDEIPDGIFDSRTICEYLGGIAGVKVTRDKKHWQLRTLHACADGIMDAFISIAYELRIRQPKGIHLPEWIKGQKIKIVRGLDRFEMAAKESILQRPSEGVPATADEVAVAVATVAAEYMPNLKVDWREGRPQLRKFVEAWKRRDSFINTPPDKNWGETSVMNSKTARL
jgi:glutathione S-transferase